MKTICVDLDNTLADYTDALRRFCRDFHKDLDLPCPDPDMYDFDRVAGWPWRTERYPYDFRDVHSCAVDAGLYLSERPYPHAKDALARLRAIGWHVLIATSRQDGNEDTFRWLDRWTVPYDAVCFTRAKETIPADVYVDDDPAQLARFARVRPDALTLHPNHAYCRNAPGVGYDDWRDVPILADATAKEGASIEWR